MREIKFRAWHPRTGMHSAKQMEENDLILTFDGKVLFNNFAVESLWAVMQFTGLKDFFDNDIYEGDIVFLDSEMRHYEIVMDCGAWKLKYKDQFEKECFEWLCDYYEDLHVIGNIHQNPELLK